MARTSTLLQLKVGLVLINITAVCCPGFPVQFSKNQGIVYCHWMRSPGIGTDRFNSPLASNSSRFGTFSTTTTYPQMGITGSQPISEQEIKEKKEKLKTDIEEKINQSFDLFEQQWEENKNLKLELEQCKTELERCKRLNYRRHQFNPEVERLEKENKELHNEVTRLKRDLDTYRDYHAVRNERDRLKHENAMLSNELTMLKQKKQKTVIVQMFSAVNQKLCQLVEGELFAMLATHLETMSVNIQREPCLHPQEHHDNVPLIVLCVNASRLGTDVQQALSNVTYNSSVVVAILHHKEIHALPSQASEKLLIGQDYKKLGLIVDIAFLTHKGMYPCEMNNRSIERLCQFISTFSA